MTISEPQNTLVLDSRLTELRRVQPWIGALVNQVGISENTRYAIDLCLEEALANIILHGYRNEPGHPVIIRCWLSSDMLFCSVEDTAPPFSPVDAPSGPAINESLAPGGNGIRLLRRFADSLVYEKLNEGNRLTISFSIQPS